MATELGIVGPAYVHALKVNFSQSPSSTMIRSYFESARQQGISTLNTLTTLHKVCDKLDIQDAKVIFEKAVSYEKGSAEAGAASVSRHAFTRTNTVGNEKCYENILAASVSFGISILLPLTTIKRGGGPFFSSHIAYCTLLNMLNTVDNVLYSSNNNETFHFL